MRSLKLGASGREMFQVPSGKSLHGPAIANVVSGRDVPAGESEGESPGQKRFSLGDGRDGESMPLHYGVIQHQLPAAIFDAGPRSQGADGDGGVVPGGGESSDLLEPVVWHRLQRTTLRRLVRGGCTPPERFPT